jgi:lysophospholipase L1-like esterase
MRTKSQTTRSAWGVVIAAAALTLGACDTANDAINAIDDIGNDAEVYYYVSLGTSLSVGVLPDPSGVLLPTDDGYADVLYDRIKPEFEAAGAQPRELRLVKLGCPGETLKKMAEGGSCPYVAGSQLEAAADFLDSNAGNIHLVTIDIGGNDFRNADCIGAEVSDACANDVSNEIAMQLAPVLAALRIAAGPDTTVVGMNYYNPYLASWLEGPEGELLAIQAKGAALFFTNMLTTTYETAGIPLADVATAFGSDNFVDMAPPPDELLPVAVANICAFTYMCDTVLGPDIHANRAGYRLIADTLKTKLEETLP